MRHVSLGLSELTMDMLKAHHDMTPGTFPLKTGQRLKTIELTKHNAYTCGNVVSNTPALLYQNYDLLQIPTTYTFSDIITQINSSMTNTPYTINIHSWHRLCCRFLIFRLGSAKLLFSLASATDLWSQSVAVSRQLSDPSGHDRHV